MKATKHQHPGAPRIETTIYDTAKILNADERMETVLNEGHPQVIANTVDPTERAKAKASLHESQRLAEKNGLSQITDEEINEEIRLVRAARRKIK